MLSIKYYSQPCIESKYDSTYLLLMLHKLLVAHKIELCQLWLLLCKVLSGELGHIGVMLTLDGCDVWPIFACVMLTVPHFLCISEWTRIQWLSIFMIVRILILERLLCSRCHHRVLIIGQCRPCNTLIQVVILKYLSTCTHIVTSTCLAPLHVEFHLHLLSLILHILNPALQILNLDISLHQVWIVLSRLSLDSLLILYKIGQLVVTLLLLLDEYSILFL